MLGYLELFRLNIKKIINFSIKHYKMKYIITIYILFERYFYAKNKSNTTKIIIKTSGFCMPKKEMNATVSIKRWQILHVTSWCSFKKKGEHKLYLGLLLRKKRLSHQTLVLFSLILLTACSSIFHSGRDLLSILLSHLYCIAFLFLVALQEFSKVLYATSFKHSLFPMFTVNYRIISTLFNR